VLSLRQGYETIPRLLQSCASRPAHAISSATPRLREITYPGCASDCRASHASLCSSSISTGTHACCWRGRGRRMQGLTCARIDRSGCSKRI